MRSLNAAGRSIALACAGLCLMAAAAEPTRAQRGRELGAARRQDQMNRQTAEYERDNLNSDLNPAAAESAERKRTQAAAAQVRQDFESLQAGYNRIALALSPKHAGDDAGALAAAVADVNKSAARLRQNLVLPQPKEEEAKGQQAAAASAAAEEPLASLGRHLYSFLTNPLFESQGVLDVAQGARAARDLERIIELSEAMKRDGVRAPPAKNP
jgi:hypothetical protein